MQQAAPSGGKNKKEQNWVRILGLGANRGCWAQMGDSLNPSWMKCCGFKAKENWLSLPIALAHSGQIWPPDLYHLFRFLTNGGPNLQAVELFGVKLSLDYWAVMGHSCGRLGWSLKLVKGWQLEYFLLIAIWYTYIYIHISSDIYIYIYICTHTHIAYNSYIQNICMYIFQLQGSMTQTGLLIWASSKTNGVIPESQLPPKFFWINQGNQWWTWTMEVFLDSHPPESKRTIQPTIALG